MRETTEAAGERAAPPSARVTWRRYAGLLALALGLALAMLDQVIAGAALPTIAGDLGGLAELPWVITAYLVTSTATTPLWGKLGDLYGRRLTYFAAVTVFLAGSALAGLAASMPWLIAFRAVQGAGAGGLMTGAFALISDLAATPADRSRMLAVTGAVMSAAVAGGPLAGGLLTEYASWRWAFYVNLPVGAVALAAGMAGLPRSARRAGARIDYQGGALIAAAVTALALLASWAGTRYRWESPQVVALAVAAAAALTAFGFAERRAADPVIPPRLFATADFTLAQVLGLLLGAVMVSVLVYLPQYLQDALGASPTGSGLLLLPFLSAMIGAELLTARLASGTMRYRPYLLAGGGLTAAGGLLLLPLNTATSAIAASALATVTGLGAGLMLQATMLIALTSAAPGDTGAASGLVNLTRSVGGAIGVALLGSVYTARLSRTLTARLGARAGYTLTSSGGRLTPAQLHHLPPSARAAFQGAVSEGLHGVVLGIAVLGVTAFAVSWFLRVTRPPRAGR